jgi:two-component system NarL family sensor kinase
MEQRDDRPATRPISAGTNPSWPAGIVVGVVGGATAAAIIGLRAANEGAEPEGQNWWLVAWLVAGVAYSAAGVVLAARPGRRQLGAALLVAGASWLLVALAVQYRGYERSVDGPARWPALAEADTWARPLAAAVVVALIPALLIPAGWRADRRAVALRGLALVATAAVVVAYTGAWHRVDVAASWVVGALGLVWIGVLAAHWWRVRRAATGPLAGWLCAGAVVAWLAVVPDGLDAVDWSLAGRDVVWAVLLIATVPLLVVGALIDELRRIPSDAEQLSHRSLEWALFAAGIIVVYTVVVAGLGRLVGGSGPTWLLVAATGAIALSIEPARRRIRQLVDKLVFGDRDDALAVVQRIVDHVGTDTGDDLLAALVRSLERSLRFDAIAIDLAVPGGGWQQAASVGGDAAHHHEVVLRHGGEVVGRLVVGWDGAPSMRAREAEMLDQLAGPLGLAVSWVRLAADLRRSSLAVVSAREEERRRLRRDLHDGVGPTLTGVSLGLRTAVRQLDRSAARGSPQPSPALLTRLADEVDGVVVEIKRIVRDLRPTALDQLGLAGAVAEFSRKFAGDLDIELSLPPPPTPPLPAAVEAAAYRIVTEALTNVVRHAHAQRCWVRIVTKGPVSIDVIDDGVGIDLRRSPGVGLTAMRERAAELGGVVRFVPGSPTGTHLHVDLPAALP